MSSNLERLGNTLDGRMKKTSSAAVPTAIELGEINGQLALTTDSLKSPIPKGQYMVDIRLTGGTTTSSTTHTHSDGSHSGHEGGNGTHSHSGGAHTHELPGIFRGIQAGDRVLVAWCGNEPVVIAIVVSS